MRCAGYFETPRPPSATPLVTPDPFAPALRSPTVAASVRSALYAGSTAITLCPRFGSGFSGGGLVAFEGTFPLRVRQAARRADQLELEVAQHRAGEHHGLARYFDGDEG